jgi:hypothetical protein
VIVVAEYIKGEDLLLKMQKSINLFEQIHNIYFIDEASTLITMITISNPL